VVQKAEAWSRMKGGSHSSGHADDELAVTRGQIGSSGGAGGSMVSELAIIKRRQRQSRGGEKALQTEQCPEASVKACDWNVATKAARSWHEADLFRIWREKALIVG
jgi:hypothetical protein